MHLTADTFYRIEVEQYGVDLASKLISPGGEPWTFDRSIGDCGIEWVTVRPAVTGDFKLELDAYEGPGHYDVRVIPLARKPHNERVLRMEAMWRRALPLRRGDDCQRLEAAATFQELAAFYEESGEFALVAYNLRELAKLQPFQEGMYTTQKALDFAHLAGDDLETARAHAALGYRAFEMYRQTRQVGYAEKALKGFFNASTFFQKNPSAQLSLGNIPTLFDHAGMIDEALAGYQYRLNALPPDDPDTLRIYSNLGVIYHDMMHDDQAALDAYERALRVKESAQTKELTSVLTNVGNLERALGNIEKAIAYYEEAQGYLSDAHVEERERITLELAETYQTIGQFDQARKLLGEISSQYPSIKTEALFILGQITHTEGKLAQARAHLVESLYLAQNHQVMMQPKIFSELARIARAEGNTDLEFSNLQKAMDAVEADREISVSHTLKTAVFAPNFSIYKHAVERKMAVAADESSIEVEEAFDIYERARGKSLREVVLLGRNNNAEPVDLTLIAQYFLSLEIGNEPGTDMVLAWQKLRQRLTQSVRIPPASALKMREIQRHLEPDTLMLCTYVGEQRTYVWSIWHNGFSSKVIQKGQHELKAMVDSFRTYIEDSKDQEYEVPPQAWELAKALLPTQLSQSRFKRAILVPDGVLGLLPWSALPYDEGFLIERFDLVSLPTASLVATSQRRQAPLAEGSITIFADPVFGKNDPRFQNQELTHHRVSDLTRDIKKSYARLGGTGKEAKMILGLNPQTTVHSGFAATRGRMLSPETADAHILHLATHGDVARQAMVFCHYTPQKQSIPWALTIEDIAQMKLKSQLVVLSACQTAIGEHVAGEGLNSLSRAFMLAGAPRVMATLWNISDRESPKLMGPFYHGIFNQKVFASEALALAQKELLNKHGRTQHPYYWSGFVLLGDWR